MALDCGGEVVGRWSVCLGAPQRAWVSSWASQSFNRRTPQRALRYPQQGPAPPGRGPITHGKPLQTGLWQASSAIAWQARWASCSFSVLAAFTVPQGWAFCLRRRILSIVARTCTFIAPMCGSIPSRCELGAADELPYTDEELVLLACGTATVTQEPRRESSEPPVFKVCTGTLEGSLPHFPRTVAAKSLAGTSGFLLPGWTAAGETSPVVQPCLPPLSGRCFAHACPCSHPPCRLFRWPLRSPFGTAESAAPTAPAMSAGAMGCHETGQRFDTTDERGDYSVVIGMGKVIKGAWQDCCPHPCQSLAVADPPAQVGTRPSSDAKEA
ncbi:hypothetical protein FH972_023786 [Carpinus fangiana]|uniref:Uncharacterized protein n=1 Tax=Carpinus fangiana TaxID=176857 RepID=A0A5N6KWK0_9ROSI|nr:hypothetical protein FH972_023786 [Carpinus fangiana]